MDESVSGAGLERGLHDSPTTQRHPRPSDVSSQANHQGDRTPRRGPRARHHCCTTRRQPPVLRCNDPGSRWQPISEWRLQTGAVLARRVPHEPTKGPVSYKDLPSQHRQARPYLFRYPERQVVPGAPDPHSPPLGPSPPLRTEPRRPARDGRREALQGEREGCAASEPRVDRAVRVCLVPAAMITTTTVPHILPTHHFHTRVAVV